MFEDEFAAAVPELDRALVRLIRLVEQAEDAFGRNAHLRKARVDAREVAKRRHQQKKRGEEGDEVTHRQEPEARLVHGEGQHDGDADMQITCVSGVPSEETFVISSSILRIVSLMLWKRPSSYS